MVIGTTATQGRRSENDVIPDKHGAHGKRRNPCTLNTPIVGNGIQYNFPRTATSPLNAVRIVFYYQILDYVGIRLIDHANASPAIATYNVVTNQRCSSGPHSDADMIAFQRIPLNDRSGRTAEMDTAPCAQGLVVHHSRTNDAIASNRRTGKLTIDPVTAVDDHIRNDGGRRGDHINSPCTIADSESAKLRLRQFSARKRYCGSSCWR